MKVLSIIKYTFGLVGLGMLAGAALLGSQRHAFIEQAARAEGTVVNLVGTYRPVVRFTDHTGEEVEFMSAASSDPPSFSKGEKVQVLYPRSQPRKAEIDTFFTLWGGVVIIGGLGCAFFLVGFTMLAVSVLAQRRSEHLKRHGVPVFAEFQAVELNTALSVNDRHPFRVLAHWRNPATSDLHVFKSHNLWFDPSAYIKTRKIKVFIDRNNPRRYVVDLSFLPKVVD